MRNPFVDVVEEELVNAGLDDVRLVYESFDAQRFGNAEAVYRLGVLQLRFVRDRGDDTLSIGSASRPQDSYDLEDVALWMEWLSFAELETYGETDAFDEPPPGPIYSLEKALSLIKRDFAQLSKAFSSAELMSTHEHLKRQERRRADG